jgi:hypothetical protein
MKTYRTLRPTFMQRLQALRETVMHQAMQWLWQWSQRSSRAQRPALVPVRISDERNAPHRPAPHQRQRFRPYAD